MQSSDEHEETRSAPPALPQGGDAVDIWDFTSESVADILECADIAVEAIVDQAEQQALEDIAAAHERAVAETAQRRTQLDRLRRELGSRASTLVLAYDEVLAELEAVDRALSGLEYHDQILADPDETTRVTVRERQTIHFAGELPIAEDETTQPPADDAAVPWQDAA